MASTAELLVEHYHKSFEITLTMWEQRNLTFLILLVVVGVATLLTYDVPQAQPLLVDIVAKLLAIDGDARKNELRTGLPYGLIQSIFLMTILYLTLVLYHRTSFINRSYKYLHGLEDEIRALLKLPASSIAFSREGKFYWDRRPKLSRLVGAAYVGMLGILLFAFLWMRITSDLKTGSTAFAIADIFLAVPTVLFFLAYTQSSIYFKTFANLFTRVPNGPN